MRKIIHCDADCFFAAVEMRDTPSLRHVPMAVGGSVGRRGVISTSNYEARRYGVYSAMASWQALKLCPNLVLLPHNMEKYRQASAALKGIFLDYSDTVEMLSVDEAYLDVTASDHWRGSATLIAQEIRNRARQEIGITVSAGVATNKFLAKVASEWRKPDNLFVIRPEEEAGFIEQLPVNYIHGVGKVTAAKLGQLGINTCGELRQQSLADLVSHFGSFALRLREFSLGIDNRPVKTSRIRKSLSVEHTFTNDLGSPQACLAEVDWLYRELIHRLKKLSRCDPIKKIQVKIKFSDFSLTSLEQPCSKPDAPGFAGLIRKGLTRNPIPVRLLGLGVQFAHNNDNSFAEQLDLFATHSLLHPVGVQ